MTDTELIKSKLDIVDIVSKYVDLKRAGRNYKGICPFHNEKTPSFMVNPELQIFKCFGCGKGGDIFEFIQEIEKVDFPESLRSLAETAGVELKQQNPKNKEFEKLKKRALKAHELAAKYYNHILKTHKLGEKGRKYAQKRQISSKEMNTFMFGAASKNKFNLKNFLNSRNFEDQELIDFGLLVDRNGEVIDKFRDRLMQPIFSLKGDVIGFSGRYIGDFEGAPKYLNSPETVIFKKNEELYSLYHSKESLRKLKKVILVEGNLDVVSSHRVGVQNIVAPLGTAFTQNQAKLLKRFVDTVLICFDSDTAGINATIRALEILENVGLSHQVINLGEYQDADDFIKEHPKKWAEKIEDTIDTVAYLRQRFSKGIDLGSVSGKNQLKRQMLPVLKSIKDNVSKNHQIKELSIILEVSQDELLEEIKNGNIKRVAQVERDKRAESVTIDLEKYLLSLLLGFDDLKNLKIDSDIFVDDASKELFEIIIKTDGEIAGEITKALDIDVLSLYKEVALLDTTEIANVEKEIINTSKRLMKARINSKILKLRQALANNDSDMESMKELNELTIKLKEI